MVGEKKPGAAPRRGWERVKAEPRETAHARETYRSNAPSPGEEILAKHDAELQDTPETDEAPPHVFCF